MKQGAATTDGIGQLSDDSAVALVQSLQSREMVGGSTHCYYRYPACFPPGFVRKAIDLFSEPGRWVLDPFMGGGTTLVEAAALGRNAVGGDVSELATFVTTAKTMRLKTSEIRALADWQQSVLADLNIRTRVSCDGEWEELGYWNNIGCRETWRTRKLLQVLISAAEDLRSSRLRRFARCVALRIGKWAFEARSEPATAEDFRKKFAIYCSEMLRGAQTFTEAVGANPPTIRPLCVSATVIHQRLRENERPSLVLTSPPYPGVYMPYHRWKVFGRWETPAPFWIAGTRDGMPMPHYTLGSRREAGLTTYFEKLQRAFVGIRGILGANAWIVQVVGFKEPNWQLNKYLEAMDAGGYYEMRDSRLATAKDGRLWRSVPRRSWYAKYQDATSETASEVVFFHKPK